MAETDEMGAWRRRFLSAGFEPDADTVGVLHDRLHKADLMPFSVTKVTAKYQSGTSEKDAAKPPEEAVVLQAKKQKGKMLSPSVIHRRSLSGTGGGVGQKGMHGRGWGQVNRRRCLERRGSLKNRKSREGIPVLRRGAGREGGNRADRVTLAEKGSRGRRLFAGWV